MKFLFSTEVDTKGLHTTSPGTTLVFIVDHSWWVSEGCLNDHWGEDAEEYLWKLTKRIPLRNLCDARYESPLSPAEIKKLLHCESYFFQDPVFTEYVRIDEL